MQSEIFQDQLWNFSTAYFTSSRYEVASEDMSQFLKDVSETATENDVHIFSQYNEINNKYLSTLHIYGDDKVIRQTLKNTANSNATAHHLTTNANTDTAALQEQIKLLKQIIDEKERLISILLNKQ